MVRLWTRWTAVQWWVAVTVTQWPSGSRSFAPMPTSLASRHCRWPIQNGWPSVAWIVPPPVTVMGDQLLDALTIDQLGDRPSDCPAIERVREEDQVTDADVLDRLSRPVR